MFLSAIFCAVAAAALVGSAGEILPDSVPEAITVYKNPAFFGNSTRSEDALNERDLDEVFDMDQFFDFDAKPSKPDTPDPPAAPDFSRHYGESTERPYESENDSEHQEEEENYEDSESYDNEDIDPPEDRRSQVTLKEESTRYYNPILGKVLSSYEREHKQSDCDCLSRGQKNSNRKETHQRLEEQRPSRGSSRSDSKTILRLFPAVGVKTLTPVYLVPYVHPWYKTKYRITYGPSSSYRTRNSVKIRIARDASDRYVTPGQSRQRRQQGSELLGQIPPSPPDETSSHRRIRDAFPNPAAISEPEMPNHSRHGYRPPSPNAINT